MKAIQLPGHGEKWLIDLEYGEWLPRVHVLRTEGDTGTALYFDTKELAEARIAEFEALGEQGRLLRYKQAAVPAVLPVDDAQPNKRGRKPRVSDG